MAHYHPAFSGHEPCARVWDPELTARPWRWLRDQFARLGAAQPDGPWQVDPADAAELSGLADAIVTLAPAGIARALPLGGQSASG